MGLKDKNYIRFKNNVKMNDTVKNESDDKITFVYMHGCRKPDNYITLPKNVWVISPCEDQVTVGDKYDKTRHKEFRQILKVDKNSQNDSQYGHYMPTTTQDKMNFIIWNSSEYENATGRKQDYELGSGWTRRDTDAKVNLFLKNRMCVSCPGKKIYDMEFQHEGTSRDETWALPNIKGSDVYNPNIPEGTHLGLDTGIYTWENNYSSRFELVPENGKSGTNLSTETFDETRLGTKRNLHFIQSHSLSDIIKKIILGRIKNNNVDEKHFIYVSSCAWWCNTTTEEAKGNLRVSTDFAKNDECVLGRPRLVEFDFNNPKNESAGCRRKESEGRRQEIQTCEQLKLYDKSIGNFIYIGKDPKTGYENSVSIKGYENDIVILAPNLHDPQIRLWMRGVDGDDWERDEKKRNAWELRVWKTFYPDGCKTSATRFIRAVPGWRRATANDIPEHGNFAYGHEAALKRWLEDESGQEAEERYQNTINTDKEDDYGWEGKTAFNYITPSIGIHSSKILNFLKTTEIEQFPMGKPMRNYVPTEVFETPEEQREQHEPVKTVEKENQRHTTFVGSSGALLRNTTSSSQRPSTLQLKNFRETELLEQTLSFKRLADSSMKRQIEFMKRSNNSKHIDDFLFHTRHALEAGLRSASFYEEALKLSKGLILDTNKTVHVNYINTKLSTLSKRIELNRNAIKIVEEKIKKENRIAEEEKAKKIAEEDGLKRFEYAAPSRVVPEKEVESHLEKVERLEGEKVREDDKKTWPQRLAARRQTWPQDIQDALNGINGKILPNKNPTAKEYESMENWDNCATECKAEGWFGRNKRCKKVITHDDNDLNKYYYKVLPEQHECHPYSDSNLRVKHEGLEYRRRNGRWMISTGGKKKQLRKRRTSRKKRRKRVKFASGKRKLYKEKKDGHALLGSKKKTRTKRKYMNRQKRRRKTKKRKRKKKKKFYRKTIKYK